MHKWRRVNVWGIFTHDQHGQKVWYSKDLPHLLTVSVTVMMDDMNTNNTCCEVKRGKWLIDFTNISFQGLSAVTAAIYGLSAQFYYESDNIP